MTRRVSLHDRDATGITEGAAAKTSGVVDTLIAPDVAAGDDRIVHIPVGKIVPHPRNRKILDEDVADLVAEFKAGVPILNALGVTAAADWNTGKPDDLKPIQSDEFIITAGGHRRLRAAELAGLPTAPCVIRATFAGADGRRAALLENLHRQDLDPFEEAEAFAELTTAPYKLSQRELAALCNVNQSHISKRLKLLKLPRPVRAKYDVGKLKIADCLELARLVDVVPGLVEQAAKRVVDERWSDASRVVDGMIREHETEKVKTAEVERLTAAGVKVIDRAPGWQVEKGGREPVRLDRIGIKTVSHKKEPCHAAYVHVSNYGTAKAEVVYACTEPKRHIGAKAESTVKAAKNVTAAGSSSSISADERSRRNRAKLIKKEINPARRAVVAQLLQHGGFDADTRREIVVQSVLFRASYNSYTDSEIVIDLLGIRPANERAYLDEVFTAYVERSRDLAATGAALGYFESQLRDPGPWSRWDDKARWYLELLARHGYVVTDAEHEQLGDVRGPAGEWTRSNEPDDVEPAKCRVCFVYIDDLPPGVTVVDEDLCSACSDATDAGWVDESPTLEVPRPYQQVDADGHILCVECEHGQAAEDCSCTFCACNPANVDEPAAAEAVSA